MSDVLNTGQIIGRATERAMLSSAIERGRLPGTLLFTGREGTGKRHLALWTAAALLCQSEHGPCGTCADCSLSAGLTHPDLHVYLPHSTPGGGSRENQIAKVESLREAALAEMRSSTLRTPPAHGLAYYVATVRAIADRSAGKAYRDGGRKVFLLADVERMAGSPEAQNALLKLLEEPPAGTHFILTTDAPDRLLDTIRSRATEVSIGPLADTDIRTILARGAVPEDRVDEAVSHAEGTVARALQWLDEGWQADRQAARSWLTASLGSDPGARLALVADEGHSGASGAFGARLDHLRRLAFDGAALACDRGHPAIDPGLRDALASLPAEDRPGVQGWTLAIEAIDEAREATRRNASPQLQTHRLLRALHAALTEHPPQRILRRDRRVDRLSARLNASAAARRP